MEHHANLVPWQMLAKSYGVELKFIPINDKGELDLAGIVDNSLYDSEKLGEKLGEKSSSKLSGKPSSKLVQKNAEDNLEQDLSKYFTSKTKLLAISAMSNVLGTINPIDKIIRIAHKYNVAVLVDGSQIVAHDRVDLSKLDCDFFVCSAHKLYGPTGVGVLFGKRKWLEQMPPYQTGGEMIKKVTLAHTSFAEIPYKFEAGTPNIAGVVGFGAAIDFLSALDLAEVYQHEQSLLVYANKQLLTIKGLKIIGTAQHKGPVISFIIKGIHADDNRDDFGSMWGGG